MPPVKKLLINLHQAPLEVSALKTWLSSAMNRACFGYWLASAISVL
jgi:hypothetical protein